jgi:hypothetical protein
MATAEELLKRAAAADVMSRITQRRTRISNEYDDIETARLLKRAELDAQIEVENRASERFSSYEPSRGEKLLCPHCWIVNGKESSLIGRGSVVRCEVCGLQFSVAP